MKTSIKNTLGILMIVLTFTATSWAQEKGGDQQGPPPIPNDKEITKMVSDLANDLSLNDKQETKVLDLYKTHFAKIKEKTSGNSRPKREDMEALETKFQKEVKATLTKEQSKKYDAFIKKQQSERKKK